VVVVSSPSLARISLSPMESDSFVLVHLEASDDDAPALDSIVGVSAASNADQVVVTFARQGAKVLEVRLMLVLLERPAKRAADIAAATTRFTTDKSSTAGP